MTLAVKLSLIAIAAVLLHGCATPSSPTMMAVDGVKASQIKTNEVLRGRIYIRNVEGGKETDATGTSQVSNDALRLALTRSLENTGYLSQAATAPVALDVNLQFITQQAMGITFTIQSIVRYTLIENQNRKSYPITAVGVAGPSDTLDGHERRRMANERSIRSSIEQFVEALQTFKWD